MEKTTGTMKYKCYCGQMLEVYFVFNGYLEWPVFRHQNKGIRLCPNCSHKLVYYHWQVVKE